MWFLQNIQPQFLYGFDDRFGHFAVPGDALKFSVNEFRFCSRQNLFVVEILKSSQLFNLLFTFRHFVTVRKTSQSQLLSIAFLQ